MKAGVRAYLGAIAAVALSTATNLVVQKWTGTGLSALYFPAVVLPALYGARPRPIVQRRFKDPDLLGKAASTAAERMLSFLMDTNSEEYDDFGPLRGFYSASAQSHQLFAVADWKGDALAVEGGIGFGLTPATDDLVLKLILSKDLN